MIKKQVSQRSGFTLIELLVVISIILIASSIIFIGGNSGSGASLSSALRIISGVAQGARGQAILKNAETRLIIHNDPTDLEKYRRYVGIVYRENIDDGSGTIVLGWKAATQGTYLPDGIYFDPTIVTSNSTAGSASRTMNLEYPRLQAVSETGAQYYYYAFNSNGTSANANDWLPIRAGRLNASGTLEPHDPTGENGFLKAALIFRRAGTTTSVTEPEAVQ